ncbi:MAG: HdeA/HdeB family chaperone [Bosea sp. (in: a-proteobacteria)]
MPSFQRDIVSAKRLLAAFAFAGFALASSNTVYSQANVGTSDLTNATCAAFQTLPAKDKEQLTVWLAGFFAGQASRPRINPALMASLPEAMGALCTKTPEAMLIGAEMRALFLPPQAP